LLTTLLAALSRLLALLARLLLSAATLLATLARVLLTTLLTGLLLSAAALLAALAALVLLAWFLFTRIHENSLHWPPTDNEVVTAKFLSDLVRKRTLRSWNLTSRITLG
jgi:hypothetical protein